MEITDVVKSSNKGLLYSKLADTIKKYISDNNLQVGDKLPSERFLSTKFGIGRNSVREALRFLENQGIISVRTGVGSFVEKVGEDESILLRFVEVNFSETLEIKASLELLAIKKVIETASDEQMDELVKMSEEMNCLLSEGTYPYELDTLFHKRLVDFCANSTLKLMMNQILDVLSGYWQSVSQDYSTLSSTIPLHNEMAKRMRQRDFAGAERFYNEICRIDVEIISSNKE